MGAMSGCKVSGLSNGFILTQRRQLPKALKAPDDTKFVSRDFCELFSAFVRAHSTPGHINHDLTPHHTPFTIAAMTIMISTKILCAVAGFNCLTNVVFGESFDWAIANTSVWLSAAAYCDVDTFLTRTYKGYSAGFSPEKIIDVPQFDVQVVISFCRRLHFFASFAPIL